MNFLIKPMLSATYGLVYMVNCTAIDYVDHRGLLPYIPIPYIAYVVCHLTPSLYVKLHSHRLSRPLKPTLIPLDGLPCMAYFVCHVWPSAYVQLHSHRLRRP